MSACDSYFEVDTSHALFRNQSQARRFERDVQRMYDEMWDVSPIPMSDASSKWRVVATTGARPSEALMPPSGYVSYMHGDMPFIASHHDLSSMFERDLLLHNIKLKNGTVKEFGSSITSDDEYVDVISASLVSAAEEVLDRLEEAGDTVFPVTFSRDVRATLYRENASDDKLYMLVSVRAQVIDLDGKDGWTLQESMEDVCREAGSYATVGMMADGKRAYARMKSRRTDSAFDVDDKRMGSAIRGYRIMEKAQKTLSIFYYELLDTFVSHLDENMAARKEAGDKPYLSLKRVGKNSILRNTLNYYEDASGVSHVVACSQCCPPGIQTNTRSELESVSAVSWGGPFMPTIVLHNKEDTHTVHLPSRLDNSATFDVSLANLGDYVRREGDDWRTVAASRTSSKCSKPDVPTVVHTVRTSCVSQISIMRALNLEWRSHSALFSSDADEEFCTVVSFTNFDKNAVPNGVLTSKRSLGTDTIEDGPPRIPEEIPAQFDKRIEALLDSAHVRFTMLYPVLTIMSVDDYDEGLLKISNQYRDERHSDSM